MHFGEPSLLANIDLYKRLQWAYTEVGKRDSVYIRRRHLHVRV